jgi:uncharacterized coiled-coil protein SlyX
MDNNAQRIQKLESHVAELERHVDQLNEVVVEQTRSFEKMKMQIRRLSQTLENLELERVRSTSSKPPHYQ